MAMEAVKSGKNDRIARLTQYIHPLKLLQSRGLKPAHWKKSRWTDSAICIFRKSSWVGNRLNTRGGRPTDFHAWQTGLGVDSISQRDCWLKFKGRWRVSKSGQ
ncbi:MAG: hypothetical protein ACKO5E_21805 [bacterium]